MVLCALDETTSDDEENCKFTARAKSALTIAEMRMKLSLVSGSTVDSPRFVGA